MSEYVIPCFSDHAFAFAGAMRSAGFAARVLPPGDADTFALGVELTGGKQCHPLQAVVGDIARAARCGNLPERAAYFFPVAGGTCPITQYAPTVERCLESLGRGDVRVMGTTSAWLLQTFGPGFVVNLGRGLVALEYLLRLRYELRPYEVVKGSVDAAYLRARELIVERLAQGEPHKGVLEAVMLLDAVETRDRGSRPVIGIAGDVYTRVNDVANGGLFELLEELGCEVWLSPTVIDLAMFRGGGATGRPLVRELLESTSAWAFDVVKSMELWQVQKHFKGILRNLVEPDTDETQRNVEGLLPRGSAALLMLNVSKHVDFARKEVDGILNVYCLNCMVGTATAALYPALRERTHGVPMMSLVVDGLGTTHMRNRIEAFVHRVRRNLNRTTDSPTTAAPAARGRWYSRP